MLLIPAKGLQGGIDQGCDVGVGVYLTAVCHDHPYLFGDIALTNTLVLVQLGFFRRGDLEYHAEYTVGRVIGLPGIALGRTVSTALVEMQAMAAQAGIA